MRNVSKYFSDFSIRSVTRSTCSEESRREDGARARAYLGDVSMTRMWFARSIRTYQYYECIKIRP